MEKLVVMRFFAKVKMRCDGVLEEMDDEVSDQNQQSRRLSTEFNTLRDHLHQRGGQHEARAQGHKISKVAALPMPLNNDRTTEHVRAGGGQAEQNAGEDWSHSCEAR